MNRLARSGPGLAPARVAEVLAAHQNGTVLRGSGYLVATGRVLTAAHVLADAVSARVRFNADLPGEWSAAAETAWIDADLDVAVLIVELPEGVTAADASEVARVRYGRIGRPPVTCETVGFPRFKLRQDPPGVAAASQYRDSYHATGTVTSWSNRREGTLEVRVGAPERDPRSEHSPWEGISGAAVFGGDLLIGVVGKHHHSDGLGTLAAYPVERWYERLSVERIAELAALIGLPPTSDRLAEAGPPWHSPVGVPRQLPATTSAFTGRIKELEALDDLTSTAQGAEETGTVAVCVIDGMAGVGKSTLAVHAGHLLAGRFPDGQLFVDLYGYTGGMAPREPGDALAAILQAYGVTPAQLPTDLQARAALYRDRLAGTRTLIVLDNAANAAQVRPLLPAASGCLVVVTSRRRLRGLDDAYALSLDVPPKADAVMLLRTVAGPGRTAAGDPLLAQVAEWCGNLPLALRIVGSLLRHRPSWTLPRLARQLEDQRTRLSVLDDGSEDDRERSLTAVFSLSYAALGDSQQRLFRLVGLHPGRDTEAYGAAALLDMDPMAAERLLGDLADHSLLAENTEGRYRMHDLVRAHARDLTHNGSGDEYAAAIQRLLDYYQHAAYKAEAHIARHTRPELPDCDLLHTPTLPDQSAARRWLHAERANLEACLQYASDHLMDRLLIAMSTGLSGLLRSDGPWPLALSVHMAAAAVAQRLGDQPGYAACLTELGEVRVLTGDYPGALQDLETALELHTEADDRHGQATALAGLGQARVFSRDFPGASRDLGLALEFYRELGDLRGQANVLANLGQVRALAGDHPGLAAALQEALDLHRRTGDRRGEASVLTGLGQARMLLGDTAGALRDLEKALELQRESGDRLGQANCLNELGRARRTLGDFQGALRDLREALDLNQALGNRHGQADSLVDLGQTRVAIGDLQGALRDLREALDLNRTLGNRHGQAMVLTGLGRARASLHDYTGAISDLSTAVELFRELGVRGGEAWASNYYAAVLAATGANSQALTMYRETLIMAREMRQPDDEALALEGIGECLLRDGQSDDAAVYLSQALELFQRLEMRPDIERIQARLDGSRPG